MKRVLYLDASSGVSGDMFVGALLDAGASFEAVRADVEALGVPGFEIRARRVTRHGIAGTKFDVVNPETGRCVDEPQSGHDHAHGHDHTHGHGHDHGHEHGHHGYRQREGGHHAHRGLREIRGILQAGALLPRVAADALGVFELLAEAEAKVHGTRPEEVHFHEVGALDTIADVVAAASAFRALGADETWCSPIHVGCGNGALRPRRAPRARPGHPGVAPGGSGVLGRNPGRALHADGSRVDPLLLQRLRRHAAPRRRGGRVRSGQQGLWHSQPVPCDPGDGRRAGEPCRDRVRGLRRGLGEGTLDR